MTKKVLSVFTAIFILMLAFSACNLAQPKGEPVTFITNPETANIKEIFSFVNEQIDMANKATHQISKDKFYELFSNPMLKAVSYSGDDDINISHSEYIDKTLIIKTTGTAELASPVKALVLEDIGGTFTAQAKADSIVINGDSITTDIKYETGVIYIEGKDATVNIYEITENIFAHNASAIINNLSDKPVTVTLANGTQTVIAASKSYNVYENLVYDIR